MSDVSVRLTLQEDVSSKLSRVSSAARTSVTQLQQAGQQIDRAFSSNSPEQFASSLGNAMDRAASSMDSLGDSVGQAMEELEQSSAVDFSEGFENAATSLLGQQRMQGRVLTAYRNPLKALETA